MVQLTTTNYVYNYNAVTLVEKKMKNLHSFTHSFPTVGVTEATTYTR